MKTNKITKLQYNELTNCALFYGIEEFHKLLEKYTGIKAISRNLACFTIYDYKDNEGRFLGNVDDLDTILQSAHIRILE